MASTLPDDDDYEAVPIKPVEEPVKKPIVTPDAHAAALQALFVEHRDKLVRIHALYPVPNQRYDLLSDVDRRKWGARRAALDEANQAYFSAVNRLSEAHKGS